MAPFRHFCIRNIGFWTKWPWDREHHHAVFRNGLENGIAPLKERNMAAPCVAPKERSMVGDDGLEPPTLWV